jgi:hypothetical protein
LADLGAAVSAEVGDLAAVARAAVGDGRARLKQGRTAAARRV